MGGVRSRMADVTESQFSSNLVWRCYGWHSLLSIAQWPGGRVSKTVGHILPQAHPACEKWLPGIQSHLCPVMLLEQGGQNGWNCRLTPSFLLTCNLAGTQGFLIQVAVFPQCLEVGIGDWVGRAPGIHGQTLAPAYCMWLWQDPSLRAGTATHVGQLAP